MAVRGIIRDIICLYVGYRLIKMWVLKEQATFGLGALVVVLMLMSGWFILERIGILK